MRCRTSRALGIAGALAVTLIAVSGARVDAADEIGFSADGVTWSAQLTEPLFDPTVLWVPGDTRTATFFVRNQTTDPAVLAIDVTATDSGGLLASDAITITGAAGGGAMSPVDAAGIRRLITDARVQPNATVEVAIVVEFHPGSTNETQAQSFAFQLRATLAEDPTALAPPTTTPPALTPTPDAPNVPATGGGLTRPLVVVASFCVALGLFAITAARQRLRRG